MPDPRHPDKDVQAAIAYAVANGWRLVVGGSHRWGCVYCPHRDRDGCWMSVWSTPRDPTAHARDIRREVDRCPHGGG